MPSSIECVTSNKRIIAPIYPQHPRSLTVESRPLTPEHKEQDVSDTKSLTTSTSSGVSDQDTSVVGGTVDNWTLFFEDFVTQLQQSVPNSLYNRWKARLVEAGFGEFMVLARCAREIWDECKEQWQVKFDDHTELFVSRINLLNDNLTQAPEYGIEFNIVVRSWDLNQIAFIPYCHAARPLQYFNHSQS